MKIISTAIPDVKILEPKVFGDERGFFMETWNDNIAADAGIESTFVQDNHSRSLRNTLRGLHYQRNQPQGKLVRVTRGEVFDVAVDVRKNSPTFGQWVGEYLSEENKKILWVPPGFAHGFIVLSDTADFQYKCTDFYAPGDEHCIHWADKTLSIAWPLQDGEKPLTSPKDADGKSFADSLYC
jgi:dTDP-4-dehydrorhamnose 3,5-epimerase